MDTFLSGREQMLGNIVETAPFPIGVYTGNELTIALANPAIMKAWGKGSDVVGKRYTEILPELENQQIFDQLRNVLSTGLPYHAKNQKVDLEIEGILKTHYFNYSFTPLFDNEGNVYGVMNTAADVTDLNLAQQKLIEAEGRLVLAVDSAQLGTYETDLVSETLKTSDRFNEIWGVKPPVTRKRIIEAIHPDDRQVREKAHEKAMSDCTNVFYEARAIHPDGAVRWIRVNGKILCDDNGIPITLIGIVQDITEQTETAEHLTKLVKKRTSELQRSNEDLQQFAHVVSHDLKEPIRKIKMFIDLLENSLDVQPETQEKKYITKIQQATDRVYTLIDGVLNYSTISADNQPITVIDLNDIFNHALTDLELLIEQKKGTVTKATLPNIEGVPILIQQLFYNIINNALKFHRDGVAPAINVSASIVKAQNNNYAHIRISDNGIGLQEAFAKRIFTAFERLNPKDLYEGTGLGLALCKKIVERHHGTIEAEGNETGTTFTVCLPIKQWEDGI
ncbi:MAG: PAS domain-containing sensor histidine kinase [Flavobacterium sp. BFFFF1]|uniref:PAS domain-containing sensor histidine kinase n=1 Tax=Flavobacterium sp. BFFFF1 TaxID=2015557 RepID=UPI000BCDF110|nr:ATP-binding protein [Flavobacterium sp. BFFFF1]OYU79449.1 MAG: PAS domain-containing sensor histidine kinase [Flavobacterium sp. BFFFF1]